MGTPEFAVPSLQKLIENSSIELLAVVTQPDKPVGRKKTITPPPVKVSALKNNIQVFQPEKISKDDKVIAALENLKPDAIVTVAYGQILKDNILNLAPKGVINLHSSLLPAYRGPAPMNWMIINGDKEVGVSTMDTVQEIDAGDILLEAKTELGENETAQELAERLSYIGADLLLKTLTEFDSIKPRKQVYAEDFKPEKKLAPFMDKRLGEIDFARKEFTLKSPNPKQDYFKVTLSNSAQNLHNLIRGVHPWPGAYFVHAEQNIKILKSRVSKDPSTQFQAGELASIKDDCFCVQTQEGILEIHKVKPAGKSEMSGKDWINGTHLKPGDAI